MPVCLRSASLPRVGHRDHATPIASDLRFQRTQPSCREKTMSFTEAIRSVLNQYVGFSGRARRSEYWYWALFSIIIAVIASLLDRAVFSSNNSWFSYIVGLALLLPGL